jgi:hypothetical protein
VVVQVTVPDSDCNPKLTLQVVAPTAVRYEQVWPTLHRKGKILIGYWERQFLVPDTVPFVGLEFRELPAGGAATGIFKPIEGTTHIRLDPSATDVPFVPVTQFVPGRGSMIGGPVPGGDFGSDINICCSWPADVAPSPPFSPGTLTTTIPLQYRVPPNSTWHDFATANSIFSVEGAGNNPVLTARKFTAGVKPEVPGTEAHLRVNDPTYWIRPP